MSNKNFTLLISDELKFNEGKAIFQNRDVQKIRKRSNCGFKILLIKFSVYFTFSLSESFDWSFLFFTCTGECREDSPCQHLCFDLHDGTFECSCKEGFTLSVNGYSCIGEFFLFNLSLHPPAWNCKQKHHAYSIMNLWLYVNP